MDGFVVMVAVGHVGADVVDVEKVVTSWIGMRGSVRERGSALVGYVSYCALILEGGCWRLPQGEEKYLESQHSDFVEESSENEERR